jgi:hypothetical protein
MTALWNATHLSIANVQLNLYYSEEMWIFVIFSLVMQPKKRRFKKIKQFPAGKVTMLKQKRVEKDYLLFSWGRRSYLLFSWGRRSNVTRTEAAQSI